MCGKLLEPSSSAGVSQKQDGWSPGDPPPWGSCQLSWVASALQTSASLPPALPLPSFCTILGVDTPLREFRESLQRFKKNYLDGSRSSEAGGMDGAPTWPSRTCLTEDSQHWLVFLEGRGALACALPGSCVRAASPGGFCFLDEHEEVPALTQVPPACGTAG